MTGYINNQNLVTKVETRVDNAVVGDLLVEFEYLELPEHERRAGADAHRAAPGGHADVRRRRSRRRRPIRANLTELLTAAAAGRARRRSGRTAARSAAGRRPRPPVEQLGEGVFKIGGNYTSLAVDMGDHILVVESGQSDARGLAVMAAAKQAIPGKPIRFVVNSHPHFDHASGLAAAVAEGATILTHRNNEQVLERLLGGPRTLTGDSLSKVTNRRTNVVEGVGDRDVRRAATARSSS